MFVLQTLNLHHTSPAFPIDTAYPHPFPTIHINSYSGCANPEPAPPAVRPPLPLLIPIPPNCSHRKIVLVGLRIARPHGHGQDRQGVLVYLHTESRKERDGIPSHGRKSGLTAGLAVPHAREKELMKLQNGLWHRPAGCVSTRIRGYEMSRRGGGGVLWTSKSKGEGFYNISRCELMANWRCLYAVHID